MGKFSLTSTTLCPECNKHLAEAGDEHDCVDWASRTHTFTKVGDDDQWSVEATSVNAAWRHLAKAKDDPVFWIHESGDTAAEYSHRMGEDIRDL